MSKYFYTFHAVINLFSWVGIKGLRVPGGPWSQICWIETQSKIKDSAALHPLSMPLRFWVCGILMLSLEDACHLLQHREAFHS